MRTQPEVILGGFTHPSFGRNGQALEQPRVETAITDEQRGQHADVRRPEVLHSETDKVQKYFILKQKYFILKPVMTDEYA